MNPLNDGSGGLGSDVVVVVGVSIGCVCVVKMFVVVIRKDKALMEFVEK